MVLLSKVHNENLISDNPKLRRSILWRHYSYKRQKRLLIPDWRDIVQACDPGLDPRLEESIFSSFAIKIIMGELVKCESGL